MKLLKIMKNPYLQSVEPAHIAGGILSFIYTNTARANNFDFR